MSGTIELQTVALIIAIIIQIVTVGIQAYSVVAISRAGRQIAQRQLDVAHAKHQYELFDRRFGVIQDAAAVIAAANNAIEKPKALQRALDRFASKLMAANFLFDDQLVERLHRIQGLANAVARNDGSAATALGLLNEQLDNGSLAEMLAPHFEKMRKH